MKKQLIIFLCCSLCFLSCDKIKKQAKMFINETPVVEINNEVLYQSDLEKVIPDNISDEDSTLYANDYIKKWVIRNLMYEKASKNVRNMEEIDQLVSDYRKSLLIHRYQQELIAQRIKEPSEEQLRTYYDNNSGIFKLKEDLIKGLYIKVPKNAPKVEELKTWITHQNSENLQEIEKYSYQNAVNYEYFGESWVPFGELLKKIPIDHDAAKKLLPRKMILVEDDEYIYILYANEFRGTGDTEPYDFARDEIKIILMNINKNTYINNFENDLYNKALKKGDIKVSK